MRALTLRADIDSQIVKLKSLGADPFYDASTPKFAEHPMAPRSHGIRRNRLPR
jgi:hypothetical protein